MLSCWISDSRKNGASFDERQPRLSNFSCVDIPFQFSGSWTSISFLSKNRSWQIGVMTPTRRDSTNVNLSKCFRPFTPYSTLLPHMALRVPYSVTIASTEESSCQERSFLPKEASPVRGWFLSGRNLLRLVKGVNSYGSQEGLIRFAGRRDTPLIL